MPTIQQAIHDHVEVGSQLFTDEHKAYSGLGGLFFHHEAVNHSGGAGALLDRYDIALNNWAAIAYIGTETFTTGSSAFVMDQYVYVKKDGTNRFFRYDVVANMMYPFSTNMYTDGAGVLGQKIWVKNYDASHTIQWLYSWQNTGTALHRVMLID